MFSYVVNSPVPHLLTVIKIEAIPEHINSTNCQHPQFPFWFSLASFGRRWRELFIEKIHIDGWQCCAWTVKISNFSWQWIFVEESCAWVINGRNWFVVVYRLFVSIFTSFPGAYWSKRFFWKCKRVEKYEINVLLRVEQAKAAGKVWKLWISSGAAVKKSICLHPSCQLKWSTIRETKKTTKV